VTYQSETPLEAIFEAIEGIELENRVNLASSQRLFRKALRREDAYRELVSRAADEPTARTIAERVLTLSSQPAEDGYEHPHDTAVGAYLAVLDDATSPWLAQASGWGLRLPSGWWAPKLARDFESRTRVTQASDCVFIARLGEVTRIGIRIESSDARGWLFPGGRLGSADRLAPLRIVPAVAARSRNEDMAFRWQDALIALPSSFSTDTESDSRVVVAGA